jgi:hypothetical protein
MTKVGFEHDPEDFEQTKRVRMGVIRNGTNLPDGNYDIESRVQKWDGENPLGCKTTGDILEAAKKGQVEVEAKILGIDKDRRLRFYKLDTQKFIEAFQRGNRKRTMREAVDAFSSDEGLIGWGGSSVGQEVVPLLGGPFTKQLYYYDYLRMHALAFYAFHNDPIAKRIVEITRDFVLGRGFKIVCDNPKAQALWDAFAEVNQIEILVDHIVAESSIYGENFLWWLPNHDTKIGYRLAPGQEVPKGLLPRVRLLDPSGIWEIVTFPEDITRVLYYYYNAPTQYQLYGGTSAGKPVPTTKYIVQQVPADQVDHFKLNCVSNEKRGRSDLYSVLGDLKRLRDTIDYEIILQQKQSAWAIDTTIEGSQTDVDNYVRQMESLGTIPTAGNEFAHTKKIERQYLSNTAGAKGSSSAFHNVMNKICAGSGIPYSYFGFQDASGQTRASALVATEPVAKKFEKRQDYVTRIAKRMAKRLFDEFGVVTKVEVVFPEIITQDRSAKFKDLALAESQGWVSNERASGIAAKELGIDDYDYEQERKEGAGAQAAADPSQANPLTAPPQSKPSAVTGEERKAIGDRNGF